MFRLDGKIALVTGASQGIGEAIAKHLAAQGATVVCAARTLSKLQAVADAITTAGGKADVLAADLADTASVKAAIATTIERHGAIHILVNNAGITRDKLLIQMKEEDWDAVIDTNLKGAYTAIQAATKPMMKQRWGRIINIASVVGQMGNAGQANYVAAKAGLIGLTKSVARELASRNVTANAVTPGYIETAMTAGLPEDVKAEFTKQIPLGRMGTGADIAAAVAFLASEEAGYITGQVLSVNGGMLMA
ncbi:beta-ketoacyl-ACP reductase [Geothrix limicola]|uniref:3-oxoacyl-[acyl-carrier-protein] reductase n=1 Tax=Geothrix limicola TaxID=2927978 RepID=A0ABQ5Q9T6_9BACT|nr:3-oxoacyl-[acyl-carrier-protein] reductase [Geothrix limicola]GLH71590.1 beta-ketoacyl-ACP reductase [Geothrix limicola]